MQYAKHFNAKFCNDAHIKDKSTFTDIFLKGVKPTICHSRWVYWGTHPQVDVTSIVFEMKSLLALQIGATKLAVTNNQAASTKQYGKRTWNKTYAHTIEIGS